MLWKQSWPLAVPAQQKTLAVTRQGFIVTTGLWKLT
jgi:hypothetical protein